MSFEHVGIVPAGPPVWGLQLPIQSQSALYAAPWERECGPDELAAITLAAEAAGAFYVGVCDHTAIPRRLAESMSTIWYDTMTTLGWLAAVTTRVRLLSHVLILAQRHPARAAKEFATLDHLSKGRAIIGVGAGHVSEEYALFGPFEARGRQTDEAIAALAALLRDDFVELPGPTWPMAPMGIGPRPVQQPRPPIWVGGSSPPALRRAALLGDGWLPQGTRRADMAGQIDTIVSLRAEYRSGAPIDLGVIAEPIYLGTRAWDPPGWALSGGPEAIAESLREFGGMGVNHIQIRVLARDVQDCCDQLARFGAEVAPLL